MKNTLTAIVLLLAGAMPAAAQKKPVTIDDVLNLKVVASPMVSPDGKQVLYTVRQWEADRDRMESRTRIWRVPVAGGAARQITFGERGDSQPQWSPDGRYISFVSARGAAAAGEEAPRPQIYVMRADGGEAWKLTDAKEGMAGNASYAWSPDSRQIAYVSVDPRSADQETAIRKRDDERVFEGDFRYTHIWVIDVDSKAATRVTEGSTWTVRGVPSWAPDSRRLAFAANVTGMLRDSRTDVFIADAVSKQIDKISTNPGSDEQPEWSPDGSLIAFVSDPVTGKLLGDGTWPSSVGHSHLMLYDVAKKTLKDVSSKDFDFETRAPRWNADSKRLVFTTGNRAYTEAYAYDLGTGKYSRLTYDTTLQLGSRSKDGTVVVVTMDTPTMPAEVYRTDSTYEDLTRLTDTNPQAKNFELGASEVVTWKSSDGTEVEGVLLKPAGQQPGRKYPLLVVAHGGPSAASTNGYRVGGLEGGQLWAGQGWAVLYPNPRGSSNYGEKFMRANINDWGGGDYKDIMAGVDAMVARGIADPDRLAHIGWSYGGYMTAWVISQTTRFKAAMVGAGLTNMVSMYGTNDIPNALTTYFGGIPGKDTTALYTARSAMSFVDNVMTPTLILHGGSDERVPIGQAYELFRALKDRGKTVELVSYPREPHGIQEYYHLKDRLTRIQEWVTRYTLGDTRKITTQQP